MTESYGHQESRVVTIALDQVFWYNLDVGWCLGCGGCEAKVGPRVEDGRGSQMLLLLLHSMRQWTRSLPRTRSTRIEVSCR